MSRTIGTLIGCAIGDALGNPFEMKPAASPALQNWDGLFKAGGTFWKGEPGQYTDDTLMTMALAASLIEHQGFNPEDVASKYLAWYESGNTRGIGTTTAGALMNLKLGATWQESGLTHGFDGLPAGGNGTAMRASPIGLVYRHDPEKLLQVATQDASITHNSLEPKLCSAAVAMGVALLANRADGADPLNVIYQLKDLLPGDSVTCERLVEVAHLLRDKVDPMVALAEIGKTGNRGYAPETVASAFYCLAATDNFKDCVVLSIKCGGDTDSTAAVAGALAGTWYGIEGISEEYHSVENRELLQILTDELLNIEI
jgi:ADP-ribosyl-[dinitrogen reductase] hydrolase